MASATTVTTSTTSPRTPPSKSCYLLWHRRLPTRAKLGNLQSQLVAARQLPEPVLRLMRALPAGDGMDALRTLTSALGH